MRKIIARLIIIFLAIIVLMGIGQLLIEAAKPMIVAVGSTIKDVFGKLAKAFSDIHETINSAKEDVEIFIKKLTETRDESEYNYPVTEELINSNLYQDWNRVALSTQVTEEQLSTIAQRCANINNHEGWAKMIAKHVIDHEITTKEILLILLGSQYYGVWNEVASAQCADEEVLIIVAKKCAAIEDDYEWPSQIAENVNQNKTTTSKVLKELVNSNHYSVLNIVAESKNADEEVLILVAKKCANMEDEFTWRTSIAKNIVDNKAVTRQVLKELMNSTNPEVVRIANEASKKVKK